MATRRFLSDILRGDREERPVADGEAAPTLLAPPPATVAPPPPTPAAIRPSPPTPQTTQTSSARRNAASAARRFEPIDVASACDLVVDAIEREIVSGRLPAGEPVGTEAALCSQFGVNRSTVREAIRVLEQGGLVRRGSDRRLYVGPSQGSDASGRLVRLLLLREVTGREAWDVLRALEIAAAAGAATACDDADLEALEANLTAAQAATRDPRRLAELDAEFHACLAKASRNGAIEMTRAPVAALLFPTVELACRGAPDVAASLIGAHRALVAALRKHDASEAALCMSRHLSDWRRDLRRAGYSLDEPIEELFERAGLRLPGRAPRGHRRD